MEDNKLDTLQNETEAIKAVKDELTAQLNELKNNYETTINTMRTEHAKQIREILKSGAAATSDADQNTDEDDIDDDGISKSAVRAEIDRLNKQLKRF